MEARTAIVTGASGEIGAAIASCLAEAGFRVCVNYLNHPERGHSVLDGIQRAGGEGVAVRADVRYEHDVSSMFALAIDKLGPISVLVNNAGIIGGKARVENVPSSVVRHVLDVNVVGAFICSREAIRHMSTKNGGSGGVIINISSRASELGNPDEWIHYAASKGALDTFTVGLAKEVAGEGIRVNAVNPGLIATSIHATSGGPERLERLLGSVPMGRCGSAFEVASVVRFLASSEAAYVTGVCLHVSGGR